MRRYFEDVKVGDIVYDKNFGKGKVIYVDDTFGDTFTVSFLDRDEDYTKDGKLMVVNENMEFIAKEQTLFYEKDILSKKPKKCRSHLVITLKIEDEKISFSYKAFETKEEAVSFFEKAFEEFMQIKDRYNVTMYEEHKFVAYNLFERIYYMLVDTNETISFYKEELNQADFIRGRISKDDVKY